MSRTEQWNRQLLLPNIMHLVSFFFFCTLHFLGHSVTRNTFICKLFPRESDFGPSHAYIKKTD